MEKQTISKHEIAPETSEGFFGRALKTIKSITERAKDSICEAMGWTKDRLQKQSTATAIHEHFQQQQAVENQNFPKKPDYHALDALVGKGSIKVLEIDPGKQTINDIDPVDATVRTVNTTDHSIGGGPAAGGHLKNPDGSKIKMGDVIVTSPEASPKLINVATADAEKKMSGAEIKKSILDVLHKAKELGLKSVRLPDFSQDGAILGMEPIAQIMREALAENIDLVQWFDQIQIVLLKPGPLWKGMTPFEIFKSTFSHHSNVVELKKETPSVPESEGSDVKRAA